MHDNRKVLSTFLAVAENKSFRKAAEKTQYLTAAVSMQIKDGDGSFAKSGVRTEDQCRG